MASNAPRPTRPAPILYGQRFDDGTPVLATPFRTDGTEEITAVLGQPGAGKSYWLTEHAKALAAAGVPLVTIDPLGDLRELFGALDARTAILGPGAADHVNPFRRSVDDGGADLRPVFRVVLGEDFTPQAEAILGQATAAFYAQNGDAPERTAAEFISILRGLDVPAPRLPFRDHLAAQLAAACESGPLADLFGHLTDVDLSLADGRPLYINFTDEIFDDEYGTVRALSILGAFGLARAAGLSSNAPKALLVNDLDRLLYSRQHNAALVEAFRDILRVHRHGSMAVTFVSDLGEATDDTGTRALRGLIRNAGDYMLFRMPAPALRVAADLAGVDLDLVAAVLKHPGEGAARNESRPAIFVSRGVARALRIVGSA